MKIGILGFAHGHVDAYCAEWRRRPELGIEVAAGWDHDTERLGQAAQRHGVRACADAGEVLGDVEIGAIVIAAETSLHAELVERACAAGKVVVLQKPMALTLAEADRIAAAVDDSGVRFTMAWQMRADPQNVAMKELVDSGQLGRIFMVRRRHGLAACLNPDFARTWHVDPGLNRDIWADDASHPIDFVHWLLGIPQSVMAEMASLFDPRMPMDNGIAVFRYPDGPIAEVCCSFTSAAGENTTEIVGEEGVIIQNYGDGPSCNVPRPDAAVGLKLYRRATAEWTAIDIPTPDNHGARIAGLAEPLAEFLHARRGPIATAEEGRTSLRMVLACYVSSREGRRVRIDDDAVVGV
jgi:predicted dehydrogenase